MSVRAPRSPRRAGARAVVAGLLAAGLAVSAAGCGGRRLVAGTTPFPAAKPVFTDSGGRALNALPPAPEPVRLVVFDFPWCPPCGAAWTAVGRASAAAAPGTLRVYRIVFDRERYFTRDGVRTVPPLRPARPPEAPAGSSAPAVTTLTALPDAFRAEYELGQAPVILLLTGNGKVVKRWTGYSPALAASLEAELRRAGTGSQDSSESPPPPP